jgi:hypothetical protein
MRVLLGLSAALASSLGLAALGPRYGGELVVGLPGPPPGTRARAPADAASRAVRRATHETLLGIGPDGLPEPALATSWHSAASGSEWTLLIAEGLRFHDGEAVDGPAAVRSLRSFLRERSPGAQVLAESLEGGVAFASAASEALPGLSAPDATRLVLRLTAPRARPFAPLASGGASIVSGNGAGCGPFVPTGARPGPQGWRLAAFSGHRAGRPFLDAVTLRFGDASGHAGSPEDGGLDLVPGAGVGAPAAALLLHLDAAHPVLAVAATRRALAGAFDRAGLARFAPGAAATPSLLPSALLPPLPWPDGGSVPRVAGRLRLVVDRGIAPAISQRVAAHLTGAGFDVEVLAVRAGDLWEARADARLLLWLPEVPEPGIALRELADHTHAAQTHAPGLAAAALERDEDRRRRRLHEIGNALLFEAELIPLLDLPVSYAARAGVHGARVDAAGALRLDEAWLEP